MALSTINGIVIDNLQKAGANTLNSQFKSVFTEEHHMDLFQIKDHPSHNNAKYGYHH